MKKLLKLILPLFLIGLAIVFGPQLFNKKFLNKGGSILVSGNIEVTDSALGFKIPGRVTERFVSEGELIEAGQTVALLENKDLEQEVALTDAETQTAMAALKEFEAGSRPEEIAEARATMDKALARMEELLAGSRPQEIAAAEATVQRVKADLEYYQTEYERQKRLFQQGVSSAEEQDRAKKSYAKASAELKEAGEKFKLVQEGPRKEEINQAEAGLKETQERYALIKKGPRKETIDQARARLEKSNAALALAQTRLAYATLTSPITGVVLSENIEPGEYVAAGMPVVTVGDLYNVWVRVYIDETDLGRVKLGHRARVTTDTYPGKRYEGVVSFISSEAEFTPKNVQTKKERVKLVYRVKVNILNPNMELKPGMPADAEILANEPPVPLRAGEAK